MTDKPTKETTIPIDSECLARAYALTIDAYGPGTGMKPHNIGDGTLTYRATKWDFLKERMDACQSTTSKLPDMEVTVSRHGFTGPITTDIKHPDKK